MISRKRKQHKEEVHKIKKDEETGAHNETELFNIVFDSCKQSKAEVNLAGILEENPTLQKKCGTRNYWKASCSASCPLEQLFVSRCGQGNMEEAPPRVILHSG
nr:unnamed protein product [Callosobruchus analis]